jgi:hypothetical protein
VLRSLAALLLLVALASGLARAEAGPLSWAPDPPRPDAPLVVTLAPDEGPARNATLKVCYAEASRAVLCLLPKEMTPGSNGTFSATVTEPLPPDQEFGLNASWVDAAGEVHHWPRGDFPVDAAYVFVKVAPASPTRELPVPAPGGLAFLAVLGVALLQNLEIVRRRLRR